MTKLLNTLISIIALGAEVIEADEFSRYGEIIIEVDGVRHTITAVIGVPAELRTTAKAAGGTITPYLDAWVYDAADYEASGADYDALLDALRKAAPRLWADRS